MQGTNFSGTDADHEGVWEYWSLISFLGGGELWKAWFRSLLEFALFVGSDNLFFTVFSWQFEYETNT